MYGITETKSIVNSFSDIITNQHNQTFLSTIGIYKILVITNKELINKTYLFFFDFMFVLC